MKTLCIVETPQAIPDGEHKITVDTGGLMPMGGTLKMYVICAAVQPRWQGHCCTKEHGHEGSHEFTEGMNIYRWTTP